MLFFLPFPPGCAKEVIDFSFSFETGKKRDDDISGRMD
jgi:hypothetical protein